MPDCGHHCRIDGDFDMPRPGNAHSTAHSARNFLVVRATSFVSQLRFFNRRERVKHQRSIESNPSKPIVEICFHPASSSHSRGSLVSRVEGSLRYAPWSSVMRCAGHVSSSSSVAEHRILTYIISSPLLYLLEINNLLHRFHR